MRPIVEDGIYKSVRPYPREKEREGERDGGRVGEQIDITQPQSKVEVAPVYIDSLQCIERSL